MASVAESIRNIWKIHELRTRILYTLGLLFVYRLGSYITLPGIDARILEAVAGDASQGGLFGLFNLFVGGAFFRARHLAVGDQGWVVDAMEAQGPVLLQCAVLASNSVQAGDQRPQRVGPADVPHPLLVLL